MHPCRCSPAGFGTYVALPYEGTKLPGYGTELDKDSADCVKGGQ